MTEAEDLGRVQDGVRLAGLLPYVRDELEGLEETLILNVIRMIREKTLTNEQAYAAWLELASYRALLRRISTKVSIGVAAGERQEALLNTRSE
jgi:hypothetical protein